MNRKTSILFALVAACVALTVLPASGFAISRDLVLSRGMVWVNHVQSVDSKGNKTLGVPYSQSRWAKEDGSLLPTSTANPSTKGYRTDCSGFASMCWGLTDSSGHPYSTSTADMGAKGNKTFFQITKAQLQPGDAILKSTVWGASVGHVILFCGWANSAQTSFWCMEQTTTSSHNGTIYHTRAWGQTDYRPYRYSGLEDMYSDVEESVSSADSYKAASDACEAAFTSVPKCGINTVVIANGSIWGDQVTAASIAGAAHGPVLLTASSSLPASTTAEIKRLKPTRIFILGDCNAISAATASKIASLGPSVARISGKNSYVVAANALSTTLAQDAATGKPAGVAYIASADQNAEALTIAPVLTATGRPLIFVHATSVPAIDIVKLKAGKIKQLILLGGTKSISAKVETALKKAGFSTSRVAGVDRYKTALAIANHALGLKVGFSWKAMGVGAPSASMDALAWSSADGYLGRVVVLTPGNQLDANVRRTAAANRAVIGKARVFGGAGGVSLAARKTLAIALRTGK